MKFSSIRLWQDLLFLHGHVADPRLARVLSTRASSQQASGRNISHNTHQWRQPMNFFKSLVYLGGLESIDSRIGEEEEAYGRTYGNRLASERTFGKRAPKPFHRRVVPITRDHAVPGECVVGGCG